MPGFVAGMMRHMRSLRRMQRDQGWIHTLLEVWPPFCLVQLHTTKPWSVMHAIRLMVSQAMRAWLPISNIFCFPKCEDPPHCSNMLIVHKNL